MGSGKADIVALENKCKSLLPTGLVSKDKPVDDIEYCRTAMAYSRSVRKRMDLWSFKDAFQADHDKKRRKDSLEETKSFRNDEGSEFSRSSCSNGEAFD